MGCQKNIPCTGYIDVMLVVLFLQLLLCNNGRLEVGSKFKTIKELLQEI